MRLQFILIGVFLLFASSCEKADNNNNGQKNVPVLSTTEISEITQITATTGGKITNNGGATVTVRGVCWSANENPTINDNITEDGTGDGSFISSIKDLEPNTIYYVRAYATNSEGTGYGNTLSFTTLVTINSPTITTTEVTEITQTTAVSGGNITDNGGATITERGVCWSTNENPTIDDNKTEAGTGSDSFASSITGLEPNTTYYLRAFATNSAGIGYGSAMSFTTQAGSTGSTFTDQRDGKVYQTVIIGNQEWMAENLAYAPSSGNYWAYDNDNNNVETYGYLYDWQTALNVCPAGWHLPSDEEWTELENYLADNGYNYDGPTGGGRGKIAKAMASTSGWNSSTNSGAVGNTDYDEYRNKSGFTALPGGSRDLGGNFDNIGGNGYWWSATEFIALDAWFRFMYYDYSYVSRYYHYKELGFSVRCLRD